jgi:hypothetical protein
VTGVKEGRHCLAHARAHRCHAALNRRHAREFDPEQKELHRGLAQATEGPMKTVFIYLNTSKRFGDPDHLKVFANVDAAETWFEKNDPEGVAFEYEVLE